MQKMCFLPAYGIGSGNEVLTSSEAIEIAFPLRSYEPCP
ncbi:hypothetical protein SPONL_96 [uncultured Candidatus Thioglobus sp.]|nr:hypothetical protein SPONL_96 [uncultured Candidatus Thioglobus sp.]